MGSLEGDVQNWAMLIQNYILQVSFVKLYRGFSYHSEDMTRGLLNLGKMGKTHLDHQYWGKLILSKRT